VLFFIKQVSGRWRENGSGFDFRSYDILFCFSLRTIKFSCESVF